MSGGRYNYAYSRFEDYAYDLAPNAKTPERKAFLRLLNIVAAAARAIEWNDSGDGDNRETELIREALGEKWQELCMHELVQEADELIRTMQKYITNERHK